MPMQEDPAGGGTHADGSKSLVYCSYCYRDGAFVDNFHSANEMVHFVRGKLREMGIGPLRRWLYTLHIPRLERWSGS
jgi:hypothetical protein